jgi:4-amino-4-deoxy-L-arabinose transferase-like glycosyltransferase
MDEVTDLNIAQLPFRQIAVLADGFPPLYHLLLKGWLMLWGTPLAARWLSAILGMLTVYAVYRLALDTLGGPAAIAATMLTAISPIHVWFAQESRAYALALPLAGLVLWRFHKAYTANTTRDWLIYAGVALAAVCTHYFLAIVLVLQALWLLRWLRGRQYRSGGYLVAYGILALSALPVLMLLRADLAYQSGTGEGRIGLGPLLYTLYVSLLGFSTGPSLRELHELGLREAAVGFLPWIAALAVCLLPAVILWLRRSFPRNEALGYLLVMGVGPIAVTAAVSMLFALKYKVSYVSWASIPLLIILGDAVAKSWDRRSARLGAVGLLTLACLSLGNRHLIDRYRNEDVRSLARYLKAHSSKMAPVFVLVGYMVEPLIFYLGPEWSVKALAGGPAALGTIADLSNSEAPSQAWIVYTRAFHGDPGRTIQARLTSIDRIQLSATFPGLALYHLTPKKQRSTQ